MIKTYIKDYIDIKSVVLIWSVILVPESVLPPHPGTPFWELAVPWGGRQSA